jgi:CheY-like chemotaxis protein
MLDFGTQPQLPTILVIDDDMVSREVLATVLTLNGYTVHAAADGEASLKLLESGECIPDAILMDAQMPGLSGTSLIGALRSCCQAGIFAISASQPPAEVAAAADGFLLKPFGADELQELLERRQAQSGRPNRPGAEPDDPVVSPETLAQLRNLMPEASVRQISAAIVAVLALRLTALESAMAKGDDAEIRRIGHAIKGGCAMAGALGAAHIGALIESGILDNQGNQLDNSAGVLQDLRAAALNLERMLEAEFPA